MLILSLGADCNCSRSEDNGPRRGALAQKGLGNVMRSCLVNLVARFVGIG